MREAEFRDYMFRVRAMFEGLEQDVKEVAWRFQTNAIEHLLKETPGPGNQWPESQYQAQGRLRAGWVFSTTPPSGSASRMVGGPYDLSTDGRATAAAISAEIRAADMPRESYASNEVGYGYYVHEGLGGHSHIGPRPWVEITAAKGQEFADEAIRQVARGTS